MTRASTAEGAALTGHFTRRDGEFLRLLASCLVVTAHCVHVWVQRFGAERHFFSLEFVAALLDQLSRFTLPVFFFLSGFGLTLQVFDKPVSLANYYRFRLVKIAAPFLLWSALTSFRHIGYIDTFAWGEQPLQSLGKLLWFLFIDGFDYQYYFLIVIFQFYLIFPFIYKLGRHLWVGVAALVVHAAVTSPIEVYLEMFGLRLPALHSNVLLLHFFWCFMGVFVAWHREKLARWSQRWTFKGALLFWLGVFGLLNAEFIYNLEVGKLLSDVDHFNRWSVVLYSLACLMLFLKSKPWLDRWVLRQERFAFLFTHVAPYTFFVYLVHTHLLRFVDYLQPEIDFGDFAWRIFSVVVGSYVLAWAAQWLLEDFPKLRFAFGLPKHPLKWGRQGTKPSAKSDAPKPEGVLAAREG